MNKKELSSYMRKIGREGGRKRAKAHSKEEFKKWGSLGGRPKLKK